MDAIGIDAIGLAEGRLIWPEAIADPALVRPETARRFRPLRRVERIECFPDLPARSGRQHPQRSVVPSLRMRIAPDKEVFLAVEYLGHIPDDDRVEIQHREARADDRFRLRREQLQPSIARRVMRAAGIL